MPTTAPVHPQGKMAAADFQFERPLGTGAFSKVVVGLYRPTGVRYAVKLISKQSILNAPSDEERARMAEVAKRESRMLLICEHPNIVRFYASLQTPQDLVYVTELCGGGELLQHINHFGRIPLEATRYAIAELFSAVFYLHSGAKKTLPITAGAPLKTVTIIHRDIKPENIMLTKDFHVRLIDFGTAVMTESVNDRPAGEDGGRGRAQTFCGTTYYMSPELLHDNFTCCASDYWGCGCVLYHMLTGRRPFDAPTQYLLIKAVLEQEPEYDDYLDPVAKDLIQKLLVKTPERRIGMNEIRKHPFLACVNFSTVSETDVAGLWKKETPWVDDDGVLACKRCSANFGAFCGKHFCCNCGFIFCAACTSNECVISDSRHTSPQRVCRGCFDELSGASA